MRRAERNPVQTTHQIHSGGKVGASRRADDPEPTRQAKGAISASADQYGVEVQRFGTLKLLPIVLEEDTRALSCQSLNGILADSIVLYSLYKKHHRLVGGDHFYPLRRLLEKHASEQFELTGLLSERVHTLGGIAVGDPRHVSEITDVPRPPDGAEGPRAMVLRLLEAHEIVIEKVRGAIAQTSANRDEGTNDLLVHNVLRCHERQVSCLCMDATIPLARTW